MSLRLSGSFEQMFLPRLNVAAHQQLFNEMVLPHLNVAAETNRAVQEVSSGLNFLCCMRSSGFDFCVSQEY
jgi:hypothetical protein